MNKFTTCCIEKSVHKKIRKEAVKLSISSSGILEMWYDNSRNQKKDLTYYQQTYPSLKTINAISWKNICLSVIDHFINHKGGGISSRQFGTATKMLVDLKILLRKDNVYYLAPYPWQLSDTDKYLNKMGFKNIEQEYKVRSKNA